MSKSPEEYFQEQTFAPAPQSGAAAGFTDAELAFMRKYMGLDATETLRQIGIETTAAPAAQPVPEPVKAAVEQPVATPVAEVAEEPVVMAASEPEQPEATMPVVDVTAAPEPFDENLDADTSGALVEALEPVADYDRAPVAPVAQTAEATSVVAEAEPAIAEAEPATAEVMTDNEDQDFDASPATIDATPAASAPATDTAAEAIATVEEPVQNVAGEPNAASAADLAEAAKALANAASALSSAASALSGVNPAAFNVAGAAAQVAQIAAPLGEVATEQAAVNNKTTDVDVNSLPSDDADTATIADTVAIPETDDATELPELDNAAQNDLPVQSTATAENEAGVDVEVTVPEDVVASAPEADIVVDNADMPVAEPVTEAAVTDAVQAADTSVAAAVAPEREVPQEALPSANPSELTTFQETVYQQFITIKLALEGLQKDGANMGLADALFRSLTTVQNSANYMGLEEIKVYAERTAGIVDQGRKSSTDFAILVSLLEQECGIIEDMVKDAITKMASATAEPATTGAEQTAEPDTATAVAETVEPVAAEPAAEPAKEPEPVVEAVAEPVEAPAATVTASPEPAAPAPEKVVEEAAPVQDSLASVRPVTPAEPDVHDEMSAEEPLENIMRNESELQMVAFYLGNQEFTVPTVTVQEVIRYEVPAKLPSAPEYVAGVINLRGKMTPLVYLRDMLEVNQDRKTEDSFIIVCRRKGLQFGLIIERVHTMYRVKQEDVDWGIESHLGMNVDLVSGLLKLNDNLVAIVSVDRIVNYVLEDLK